MKNREDWLKERKKYIGGSDIAAILGQSKFATAVDVYLSKKSNSIEQKNNPAIEWGQYLEDAVARAYSDKTGFRVVRHEELIVHPEYPFIAGNIDRWAYDENNKQYILECKTSGFMRRNDWGKEELTDDIPSYYLCQCAWYSMLTGAALKIRVDKVDIAVLIGGQNFRIYTYNKDEELEASLLKEGIKFWQNHIEKDIPPEPVIVSDLDKLYPDSVEKSVYASDSILAKVEELNALRTQKKNIEGMIESCEFAIKDFMKDSDILVSEQDFKPLVTWKKSKDRLVLNTEKLKAEMPEAYNRCLESKTGNRVFLVKQAKIPHI